MKRGPADKGFTIVESMIFLAVSAILLVSALAVVNGSKSKTEFNQAINDVQQQLDSIANNVANGYNPIADSIPCSNPTASNTLNTTGSAKPRGTNSDCVYIGGVVKFSDGEDYTLYSVAGARVTTTAAGIRKEVTDMVDAKPTVVGVPQVYKLKNGLTIGWMKVDTTDVYAIGFFSSFGQAKAGTADELESGSQQYNFIGINDQNGGFGGGAPTNYIQGTSATSFRKVYNTNVNRAKGVKLCFNSGSTDQSGIITFGGDNRTATSSLEIKNGQCS